MAIMRRKIFKRSLFLIFLFLTGLHLPAAAHAAMEDYPVVKLRSLDKLSARTMTFEARVGSTVKFGPIYIKIQTCRKAPPIEKPEAAAFLQIWEVTPQDEAKWVFSGWMFASSPALSSMDHPVYDVWVIDCLSHKSGEEPTENEGEQEQEDVQISPETSLETEALETESHETETGPAIETEDKSSESGQESAPVEEGAQTGQQPADEAEALFSAPVPEEETAPLTETPTEEVAPVTGENRGEAVSKRIYATPRDETPEEGNGAVTIQPETMRKPVREGIISETLPPPPGQN